MSSYILVSRLTMIFKFVAGLGLILFFAGNRVPDILMIIYAGYPALTEFYSRIKSFVRIFLITIKLGSDRISVCPSKRPYVCPSIILLSVCLKIRLADVRTDI